MTAIGRAVGDHQDFSAGFGEGFGDILIPRILAHRGADAQRADAIGAGDRACVEQADLVEHVIVGQVVFEKARCDLAALQDEIGVIKPPVFGIGATDAQRGTIGAVRRERVDRAHCMGVKGGLHHQILRLVAGHEHLWQCHEIGTCIAPRFPSGARLGGIGVDGTNGRVQLGKRQAKAVGHGIILGRKTF
ncbi:hypothetical protein GALL_498360 [mine drainage metagenome]|uniref:Uncharacterized protein n=1 Tax=mine drainage metagenome TaxID=410659 RepID=A0A1J5PCU1_9ZZZZ